MFLVPPTVRGANEIRSFNAGATTCFAVVREIDGDVWHVVDQQFEPWGTDANDADDYDIALVDKSGGMFVGSFDTNISAGYYHIVSHQSADATPDDADPATWVEYGYWDGDEWFTGILQDVNSTVAEVPTTEEIRIEMDANSTDFNTIIADTNDLQTWWANGGRLDLIQDTIAVDVAGLDGDAMRGTDSANTTVPDAAGTAAALHALTDGAIATAQADLDIITGADGVIVSTASTNAVWAMAMIDLPAGAPSATCSVLTAINYVYEAWRNKTETTLTEISLFKNDGSTKLVEADIADDGAKFTKGEYGDED